MANPLKMLKLKPGGFQFIQDVPIRASPARVWTSLMNFAAWFHFDMPDWPKMKLEPRIGGLLTAANKDGSVQMYSGVVAHIEREKLLRINGPMGMTHLPVSNVIIFELQPTSG